MGKRHSKKRTGRIIDRLTYCPKKHKNKKVEGMRRRQLQAKVPTPPKPPANKYTLKFGSFNVNGLDIEARWAIEQLVNTRGFDVSIFICFNCILLCFLVT